MSVNRRLVIGAIAGDRGQRTRDLIGQGLICERTGTILNRAQYPRDTIALVVFWRPRCKSSLCDLPEMFVLRFRSNADSLDCSAERNRQMPRQQAHPGSLGLLGTISPRTLVGLGFSTGAYALYHMTGWTPDISEWTVISVGFIQGISLGFITIPINIITFATLPAELRTEGAGVYSLVRNLGSAIGISVTGALLSINTQANHALIAGEVTPFDRAFQHGAAAQVWQLGTVHGSLLLNEEVTRQARIIAYIDDFKLMLVLAIGALPLLLLTRPPPKRKAAVQRS